MQLKDKGGVRKLNSRKSYGSVPKSVLSANRYLWLISRLIPNKKSRTGT